MTEAEYITCCYKQWLLHSILIECWTVTKCAKDLGRSVEEVQKDFDNFIKEGNDEE